MTEHTSPFPVEQPVIVLIGPTAIGKTALSLSIARTFCCEIVSVDSMQIYRYMNIGTAKATERERALIPHHLIDIADPDEEYNAAAFATDALSAIGEIHTRGRVPLLTGGTGLYLRALLDGLSPIPSRDYKVRNELKNQSDIHGITSLYEQLTSADPVAAQRIHPHDTARIIRALEVYRTSGIPMSQHLGGHNRISRPKRFSRLTMLGLTCPRSALYERINRRAALMVESGLEEEVRWLLDHGYSCELQSMQAIGYRHMVRYIEDQWSLDDTLTYLARDTRRYAKRQMTWFRKDQSITWFDHTAEAEILDHIGTRLSAWQ